MSGRASFAGHSFFYDSVHITSAIQQAEAFREGVEGQRADMLGLVKAQISSLDAGLKLYYRIYSWLQNLNGYAYSEGLQTHVRGGLYLPYLLQLQASITSGEDISGFVAANKRAHPANTSVGATVTRWYCGLGTIFLRETSTSDHSLVVATTSGLPAMTKIAAIADMQFNSTRYLVLGVDGSSTQAIWGTTDPTAGTVAFVAIAPDPAFTTRCFGLAYVKHLAFNFAYGVGMDGANAERLCAINDTTALATAWTAVADIAMGGFMVGSDPASPANLYIVAPFTADLTAITQPRRLVKAAVTSVPAATLTYPFTDTPDIVDACFFLGGLAVVGSPTSSGSGLGTSLKHKDSADNVRDFRLPQANGNKAWACRKVEPQGTFLILEMVYTDSTDCVWLYFDSVSATYHVSTPLQTKAAAYTGNPIAFAEKDGISMNLRRLYRFIPNGTGTDVARIFLPPSLLADPLVANTTEKKHFGSLYVQTLDLNYGPEEANKALVQQIYQGRWLDDNTAYGSLVTTQGVGGSAGAFANSKTYTAGMSVKDYTGGVAFESKAQRLTLSNGGTTEANAVAVTPNGLPLLDVFVSDWPDVRRFVFSVPRFGGKFESFDGMIATLRTAVDRTAGGVVVGTLKVGGVSVLARWDGYSADLMGTEPGTQLSTLTDPAKKPIQLVFREVRGTGS